MGKTILVTGATRRYRFRNSQDAGLAWAQHLVARARRPAKLEKVKKTLSGLPDGGRVESYVADLSPVDPDALTGRVNLADGAAYAQGKLALTMWSRYMALSLKDGGPAIIAVNPRSMLGSKMVKQAYGVAGSDLSIGAEILCRAALSDEFATASGQYVDNDIGQFASPHPDVRIFYPYSAAKRCRFRQNIPRGLPRGMFNFKDNQAIHDILIRHDYCIRCYRQNTFYTIWSDLKRGV